MTKDYLDITPDSDEFRFHLSASFDTSDMNNVSPKSNDLSFIPEFQFNKS